MTHPVLAHDDGPPGFPGGATLLTIADAARELRCCKAHVHNIIHGRVVGLPRLPVLRIGRRVLIRQETLKAWIVSVEGRELRAANDNQPAAQQRKAG
jgi:excisionase family DNA binding protein